MRKLLFKMMPWRFGHVLKFTNAEFQRVFLPPDLDMVSNDPRSAAILRVLKRLSIGYRVTIRQDIWDFIDEHGGRFRKIDHTIEEILKQRMDEPPNSATFQLSFPKAESAVLFKLSFT